MDITLNLNNAKDSLDAIKYSLLYFDNIKLDTVFAGAFTPIISKELLEVAQLLEREGILTGRRFSVSDHLDDAEAESLELLLSHGDLITGWDNGDYFDYLCELSSDRSKMEATLREAIHSDEAKEAMYSVYGGEWNDRTMGRSIFLYHGLLTQLLNHLSNHEAVLSNSMIISQIINKEAQKINIGQTKKPFIIMNAMQVLLPFIHNAEIEDVLEIRYSANDELLELRSYLDSVLNGFNNDMLREMSPSDIQKTVNKKLRPAIAQFERKLSNTNLSAVKNWVSGMKNPLSYAPLLTTFLHDISPIITIAASMGFITAETLIDHKIKKNEVKNDPLYFTFSLREMVDPKYW